MLLTVLVVFFYVSGVLSALNAAMTARTSQGAVAWIVALVSFPFVAVPAYWVLGRSKFKGFADAYESNKDEIDAVVEDIVTNLAPDAVDLADRSPHLRAMSRLAGYPFVGGNAAELLVNGEATFDSILAGIADARDYVFVQFYIVRDDDLGRRLAAALAERARAGVRVYLLYDEIGSFGLPASYGDELRHAGVEVSAFGANRGRRNRFQLNFRNHRKIVVVDGKVGWVGGHNVGDEYLGRDRKLSPWRDTHVRLEGPVVIQLQGVVVSDWYWATRELPRVSWTPTPAAHGASPALIVPSAPTQQFETAGLMYVLALNAARSRIWLTAPYFVPDEAVMKALELAALRGVDVRILVPGKSDSILVSLAARHYIARLAQCGIRFCEYRPGFLHQKVALIDDETSFVGTANFDNRSFRLNFEVTALIYDKAFAARMATMLEQDFDHGNELDAEGLQGANFASRLVVSLARLLAPVL